MAKKKGGAKPVQKNIWSLVEDKLKEKGIDLENLCCDGSAGSAVKVVCVAPDLEGSLQELGKLPRGQTVMIRTDEETSKTLDAWVETGYFKSRSEAAALFLKEGLKIRASELAELTDSLQDVRKAKERLYKKAGDLFGRKK